MGVFRKKFKPGNTYNLADSLRIVKELENYTTIEVAPDEFKIILIEESRILERGTREKQKFVSRINGEGSYRNIKVEEQRKFNNWQANNAKGYKGYTR